LNGHDLRGLILPLLYPENDLPLGLNRLLRGEFSPTTARGYASLNKAVSGFEPRTVIASLLATIQPLIINKITDAFSILKVKRCLHK
jgi:hypothetical protein